MECSSRESDNSPSLSSRLMWDGFSYTEPWESDRFMPPEDEIPAEVRSPEGRAILASVRTLTNEITAQGIILGGLANEVHAQGNTLDTLTRDLKEVKTRVDSMRPRLASMPEDSRIIAEAAIDHRELDRVRKQKKFAANLVLGILSAGGGAMLWEGWLRPLIHK
jgi:hypothetical protein